MKKILVFGAGGHSKVILDIIAQQGGYEVEAIITPEHEEAVGDTQAEYAVIAIGSNAARAEITEKALRLKPRLKFAILVHPRATVAPDVTLGPGTVVMAGAVINSGTRIGQHVIINTSSSVDHDCQIGDFASIAPGAHLAGGVTVEDHSLVGIGACVIERVKIGGRTIIGAGSVVVSDIPESVVAFGNPCKPQKKIRENL